jgi:hypothetical protein
MMPRYTCDPSLIWLITLQGHLQAIQVGLLALTWQLTRTRRCRRRCRPRPTTPRRARRATTGQAVQVPVEERD